MRIYQKYLTLTKFNRLLLLLFIGLILTSILSISLGAVSIRFNTLMAAFFAPAQLTPSEAIIIYHLRVPRLLATLFAGSALATSGLILQTLMNNPLASPSIIGLNAGAALGAVLMFTFFPYAYEFIPLIASTLGLLVTLLVFTISYVSGGSKISIILAGIAISNIISACLDFITIFVPDSTVSATSFLIGSFSNITLDQLKLPLLYITIALVVALTSARTLNILALGDETAHSLGINVKRTRLKLIIIAAILAGSAISYSGLIGFIGLLIPHITRQLIGTNHAHTIPLTLVIGALFTALCDLLVRILFAPYEIPVGILLAFLGGPFFIYLLIKSKRNNVM